MAALTFSVGSPHRTKYSDKTKQVFSKESNLDSRATYTQTSLPLAPSQCTRGQTTYTTDKPSHVTHLKVYHETDYTNT